MCGFVTLVGDDPQLRYLRPMMDSIRSRGPDDVALTSGTWFGLGFCLLSIVNRENSRQPVSSHDIDLAFNGEIYNFRSIKQRLWRDHGIEVNSEAQALLRLYQLCGPSFVSELDGDFAIIVLDSQTNTCHAFRDFYGVKPVYYAPVNRGKTWVFASHLKAFFQYPGFSTGFDLVALTEKRILNFWSGDRTCFESIHQLRPGHVLKMRFPTGAHNEPAIPEITGFCPQALTRAGELSNTEVKNIDTGCAQVIRRALGKRVQHSEVTPIVLALSGGIDSSLIATLAAADWPERLAAITVHDGIECEDLECATELSRVVGLTHHSYLITSPVFLEEFPRMVLECASPNPSYTAYFLGRAVREFYPDAKVFLCGEGADEFFVGYSLLLDHESFIARSLRAHEELSAQRISDSPLLQQVEQWKCMGSDDLWLDLVGMFQRDQLLNLHLVPFDHGPMAHSLECRVPYLDYEVINYIQRIPAHLRVLNRSTKILLRILLADALRRTPELARRLLRRRPSPAFFSTLGPRKWLRTFLKEKMPESTLAHSELAPYAKDVEGLFWIGSISTVFLKHHSRIDGLDFAELAQEVLNGPAT
jgi:asparagine synthase (glutamine-hydrolysing)